MSFLSRWKSSWAEARTSATAPRVWFTWTCSSCRAVGSRQLGGYWQAAASSGTNTRGWHLAAAAKPGKRWWLCHWLPWTAYCCREPFAADPSSVECSPAASSIRATF